MKRFTLILLPVLLAGCASTPDWMPYTPTLPESQRSTQAPVPRSDPHQELKTALGMHRSPADLGFDEKRFDPCKYGVDTEKGCGREYFTVVHFQLLCRDSEGTLRDVPAQLMPIVADNMQWQLAGNKGATQTDTQGFGQFSVITQKSTKNQRLILHLGPQFVGFNVSEITKIVLPKNFCRVDHA